MNAPRNEVIAMHEGREIFRSRLADGEYVIGCSDEADLKFAAEGVSRRHARLFLREDGGAIEDIGSRNGTLIGGVPIEGLVPLLAKYPVRAVLVGSPKTFDAAQFLVTRPKPLLTLRHQFSGGAVFTVIER